MNTFKGEFVGTFILVFIGLATVINACVLEVFTSQMDVSMMWGGGVIIAIFMSRHLSGAHLNPAITLAFAVTGNFPWSKVWICFLAQSLGALLASVLLYVIFGGAIASYEQIHGIVRGDLESVQSAMVFGEYFPNPRVEGLRNISSGVTAFWCELLGTFALSFAIFTMIHEKSRLPDWLVPFLIGGVLTLLISLFSPISMAGFNPIRDLIPRICSVFFGWGALAFTYNSSGWFFVYVLAPFIGAPVGAVLANHLWNRIAARPE